MNLAQVETARAELSVFDAMTLSEADAKKRKAILDDLIETRRLAGIKQPPDRLTEAAVRAVLDEDAHRQNANVQRATLQANQAKRDEYIERVRTRPARWKALGQDQAGNEQPLTVGQFLRGVALFIERHGGPNSDTGKKFGSLVKFVIDPASATAVPPESFEPETNRSSQLERG